MWQHWSSHFPFFSMKLVLKVRKLTVNLHDNVVYIITLSTRKVAVPVSWLIPLGITTVLIRRS